MSKEWVADDKKNIKRPKIEPQEPVKQPPKGPQADAVQVTHLQQTVGNRAVQRLLAQRQAEGSASTSLSTSFELDDDTVGRINRARGGGQPLDGALQKQMGEGMGHDFSGVQVHTSPESHELNQQLSAKAFTTGQDIFFRQGAYDPGSSGGRELIGHELSHVVQQSTGRVQGSGSGMTVRPAGDAFEQEADAVSADLQVQRQEMPEEEEEPVQAQALQCQEMPEEEEEPIQAQALQRQEMPEEEEEPVQAQALQRQEVPEEEPV